MVATQTSAREFFRAAYENRYTWDGAKFPGYTADVTFKQDGEEMTGTVRINPDLKGEVFGIEDEAAKKAIQGQLFEMGLHRVRRGFEETHGKNEFSFGETDETGAVEILMGGKASGDRYKVRDRVVTLVHRHIHNVVVTINTLSIHDTGEGYLSHRYDSVYHDPQTGEQKGGVSLFEDEYEKVGDYFVLTRRAIDTETENGTSSQEFLFSNVQFLDAKG